MRFHDREDAAEKLLAELKNRNFAADLVLALPRGGVVLGKIIAEGLDLPLDLVIPRKIPAPENPEFAIGAVTESGAAVWNETEKRLVDPAWLEKTVANETAEAKRRRLAYLPAGQRRPVRGKRVLVVDDGIATGLTMRAAVAELRSENAGQVTVAVPVAAADSLEVLKREADEVVVLTVPSQFMAVGEWYEVFDQVSDEEVVVLLTS